MKKIVILICALLVGLFIKHCATKDRHKNNTKTVLTQTILPKDKTTRLSKTPLLRKKNQTQAHLLGLCRREHSAFFDAPDDFDGLLEHFNTEHLKFYGNIKSVDLPINNLIFEINRRKPTQAFNDQWVNLNTIKGLHNAASKDGKMDYVLKISKKMKLPPALATVPIVESNYKSKMVSPKGAAGAWQLMPETAHDYGIKLKERFQLVESTHAALNLLKDLHEKFDNWELAFAAYNAGVTRVQNAILKNPTAVFLEDLDLPRETKDYVKRIRKINVLINRFAHLKTDISHLVNNLEY